MYRPLIALVNLAATYLGLVLGRLLVFRVDRTGVAIIGATAMVISGAIAWDAAVTSVDAHTLVLLFGMMVLAYLRLSGFFGLVIERSIAVARTPISLLAVSFSGIGYRRFLLREGPIAVLGVACVFAVIWLTYRHELRTTMAPQAIEYVRVHYPLMTKTLMVVAVMLVASLLGVASPWWPSVGRPTVFSGGG